MLNAVRLRGGEGAATGRKIQNGLPYSEKLIQNKGLHLSYLMCTKTRGVR